MHSMCMATKTISLSLDAYEILRRAKRPGESFSDVVRRAHWVEDPISAGELLRRRREQGALLSDDELERIEAVKAEDRPPEQKWPTG